MQANQRKKGVSAIHSPEQSRQKGGETKTSRPAPQKPKRDGESLEETGRRASSPKEKRERAIELLESALATARDIYPPEYGLLVRAEGATLLWQFDRERANSILKSTLEELQKLMEGDEKAGASDPAREAALQRLRFLIFQRIARLKPELLQKLVTSRSTNEKLSETISEEWTEEARAMVSVASELLPNDPKLAVRVAEQSIPLGRVDWSSFLGSLGERDNGEAERLAFMLITKFRDSSVVPAALESFKTFVLAPGRSSNLRDHFFESLVVRLRRDIHPDKAASDLEGDLYLTRSLARLGVGSSPRWQPEFENLILGFEALFRERSLPIPGSRRTLMLDVSLNIAVPGGTEEIADALRAAATIRDSRAQDKAYQALAVKAARKADIGLAEDILFRIKDEAVRRDTTLQLYGPVVRKSIDEANWPEAQKHAAKILDPLGRTMVLDSIARSMSRAGAEKSLVKDVYALAEMRLNRETRPSRAVAQSYLVLAQSLLPSDMEAGIAATDSAVDTLNRLSSTLEGIEEPPMGSDLGLWTPVPHFYSISPAEILDLTALIERVFGEIAKRDTEKALSVAWRLAHRSLVSLAHLAICKQLLAEANQSSAASNQRIRSKN